MDGLTLACSAVELRRLIGGKIEKIQQPEKYELLFNVHSSLGNFKLLISASPENCRIQLTDEKRVSPIDAPNFLMLLRKHLLNARITSVEQPNLDRIVLIGFDNLNELRDDTKYCLVCEIMGKHSNIILLDSEGNIIDSIRRVSAGMSSVRLILPHLKYEAPPAQEKRNPLLASNKDFAETIMAPRPEKALSSVFYGLSSTIAGILIDSFDYDGFNHAEVGQKLKNFYSDLNKGIISDNTVTPCIAKINGTDVLLPFKPNASEIKIFPSISAAADAFYRMRSENESIRRRTSSLEKIIANSIQRLERKIEKFSMSISDEAEIEKLRLYGELITASLYCIPPRSKSAAVNNYYIDPPQMTLIPLDDTLSAADNAQSYFKKYRKAKAARDTAIIQQAEALGELEYLKGIESDLSQCLTDSDFDEIRNELMLEGYVKDQVKKRTKLPKAKPHHFVSSDGIDIFVGKNNTQNDRLTFKESSPEDTWLHTKDIHGSHVIIRCPNEIPDLTLLEAAKLAAYFSQARNSSAVPVDFTRRRFVKKPSGAKPGMVIYTNHRTIYVTPERELIEKLIKR